MNQVRLSDQAYAGIVEIIKSEDLEVGARLPSEARLAETFGVSRAIVREALVRLASDGITEARRGAGSFVKSRPSERLAAFMPMSELPTTLGSYEVRFVLEAEAARLAATRRTAQEMAHVEEGMALLREALLSSEPAHAEDMESRLPAGVRRVMARCRKDHARGRRYFPVPPARSGRNHAART